MTGILDLTADAYHADLVGGRPTLSASIAHVLCSRSPAHAREAHPRLNPDYVREDKRTYDRGVAAHALFLEGRDAVTVVDAADWRTKDAREQRDAAYDAGRVPLLAHELGEVEAMVQALREQTDPNRHAARPPLFDRGKPEVTLVGELDGVMCRARLDWLRDDCDAIDDMKTTSRSAHPEAYSRALFGVGGDVQAAFYVMLAERLFGVEPMFRWTVIETAPPYALSVITPGADVLMIGRKKVGFALDVWRRCLSSGVWPAYEPDVVEATLPAWEEAAWLKRELEESAA